MMSPGNCEQNKHVEREITRRSLLSAAAPALAAGVLSPYWLTARSATADEPAAKSDRYGIALIGNGVRGGAVIGSAARYGDVLAVCDVDSRRSASAKQRFGGKPEAYGDYRKALDNKDVDVVVIATPDHWHTRIALDAMSAGKDVYCEKPLTLTIDEGKTLCKAVKETGRVLQVGTQQRSEYGTMFLKAIAIVQSGRIGSTITATCNLGATKPGGPFTNVEPPAELDWNMWLGQAPKVEYCPQRCHLNFRHWFEYAGGKVTDLGAHMVDIAQWALGHQNTGPIKVEGRGTLPQVENGFNTATGYDVKLTFADGNVIRLIPGNGFGLLLEGEKGRIYVNRGPPRAQPSSNKLAREPMTETVASA